MKRFPDWPQRLWAAIEARKAVPYAWGTLDCALYAADLVEAQTGVDLAQEFRGRYADEESANAILRAQGWDGVAGLADHFLARKEGRPARGDVVLMKGTRGDFLAIVASAT